MYEDDDEFGIPDPIQLLAENSQCKAVELGLDDDAYLINSIGQWALRHFIDRKTGAEGFVSFDDYLSLTDRKRLRQWGAWKFPDKRRSIFMPEGIVDEMQRYEEANWRQRLAALAFHVSIKILCGDVKSDEHLLWLHQIALDSLKEIALANSEDASVKKRNSEVAAKGGDAKRKLFAKKYEMVRQWVRDNPELHRQPETVQRMRRPASP